MIIGELMNLIAYSFTDAILVSFPSAAELHRWRAHI